MTDLMSRTRRGLALAALALTVASGGRAEADVIVDATTSTALSTGAEGPSTIGTLDLTTGQFAATANLSVTVFGLTSDASGTLYAAASDGLLYTVGINGSASQFGSASASVLAGGTQFGYEGLAYAGANGFYAANSNNPQNTLDQITPNGTNGPTVANLPSLPASGSLSFGPDGNLYFTATDNSSNYALFGVSPTTGIATEIGSGFGTSSNDGLTLVNAGGQLYGIDTFAAAGSGPISIYTIDTTTGLATDTGVAVTGLSTGFTLDTATSVPVPEPSTLALFAVGGLVSLAAARARRRPPLGNP